MLINISTAIAEIAIAPEFSASVRRQEISGLNYWLSTVNVCAIYYTDVCVSVNLKDSYAESAPL